MQTNQNIVNILSITIGSLSLVVGLISLHNFSPDFNSRNTYPVPAIQYKQAEIRQDPFSREVQIQPTGTEHDRPVVSMSHLANRLGRTQNWRASSLNNPSSDMGLGTYQIITRKAIN